MSTMAWRVHFTRRRLPWPAELRPLLALWEQQDLDAWLDAEDVPEGLPFLLDPDGRYDVELNRYFLRAQVLAGPENTQQAIAYDLRSWLSFLWCNRGGKSWQDATSEDRAAYQYWRRKDPVGPHVEGSTWDREVATVNGFYRWAVGQGLVQTSPIEQRPVRRRREWGVEEGQTPAERSHDARRGRIAWLTPAAYRQWRDVGIRGYRPDGLADQVFRGRHAARNAAFCDLMIRTGLRLSEQVSLSWLELPTLADERVYHRFLLPGAIAKWGSGRAIYIPASALRAVWDYAWFERAAAVEQARAEGRYEQLEGAMVVEDPARPVVRTARVRRPVPVARLDPQERARLLVRTPAGLEPAALWLDEHGMPIGTRAWQSAFRDANTRCRRRGVAIRCHPHLLRHSFAVITLEQLQRGHLRDLDRMTPAQRRSYQLIFGDPLDWVRRRLGHASIETTLVYLHVLAEVELETRLALIGDGDPWEPALLLHPDDAAAEATQRRGDHLPTS
jgi:site-specific recombinase XerD